MSNLRVPPHLLTTLCLRYGQLATRTHLTVILAITALLSVGIMTLWIRPLISRTEQLTTAIQAQQTEQRALHAHRHEAEQLSQALHAHTPPHPQLHTDPWPSLYRLAHRWAVRWDDYTPDPRPTTSNCQPIKARGHGAATHAVLYALLRSPHHITHFKLSPRELWLHACIGPSPHDDASTLRPITALFTPAPKPHAQSALETQPLSTYRVIAIGRATQDSYALVRDASGKIHTVRTGARLGSADGRVHAITTAGIEIYQHGITLSLNIGNRP
jgi:hypothetical protein